MKVGIFDSGIGGLSVLHHAMKVMPQTHFLYYADREHVPYGEKTVEEIRGFVEEILNFFIEKQVDAVLIACNTATSVSDMEFRSRFPVPIVGMEPAVKKAVEQYHEENSRILVAATPVTIAGNKLHLMLDRVDREHEVDLIALPGLVRFAEAGEFDSSQVDAYLRQELSQFDLNRYGTVVLGCTHFNYFKRNFCRIFPGNVDFVDGKGGSIRQLLRLLHQEEASDCSHQVDYYFSGKPASETELKQIEMYLTRLEEMYQIYRRKANAKHFL